MQERRKPGQGDVRGETRGDFTDWDNPEDEWDEGEDAPDGYYDDEDDDSYVPDETDPDYDLSEAHGYSDWEPGARPPRWLIAAASILLIVAILIPVLLRIR
jgi:hypothetical protein